MSRLNVLTFKYNLSKLLPSKESQLSDLSGEPNFEPDRKEMEKVFYKIASTKGKIYKRNLQALFTSLGTSDTEPDARKMIQALGSKKDNAIDLEGFIELHKNGVRISEIRRAFFVFDRDRDGRLNAEDIWQTFNMLGESCSLEEAKRMVKELDRNHDDFVEMDDFLAMMTRPAKKP